MDIFHLKKKITYIDTPISVSLSQTVRTQLQVRINKNPGLKLIFFPPKICYTCYLEFAWLIALLKQGASTLFTSLSGGIINCCYLISNLLPTML